MPWIVITAPPSDASPAPGSPALSGDASLCDAVGRAAAEALQLGTSDVVVLLTRAVAGGGGAVATVTGSLRAADAESRLRAAVAEAVAEGLDLPVDLVAVVRQAP